jgi:hypothetical protein
MFDNIHSLWRKLAGGEAGDGGRQVWVRFPAEFRPDGPAGAGPLPARLLNVSHSGLSLIIDHEFAGGGLVLIELPGCDGQVGGTALAYVLRAAPLRDGQWSLACSFAAELGDDDLRALSGQRRRPAGDDRRAWERCPGLGTALYFPVGGAEPTRRADIADVSPGGVGLLASERVEPGVALSVELCGPGAASLDMLACVVYVSPFEAGRWRLGCTFIRELTAGQLDALLDVGGMGSDKGRP